MSYANLARPIDLGRLNFPATSASCGAIAPHRGDVTTVRAAAHVKLQQAKRVEKLQSHAPSHRTAGTAAVPVAVPGLGWA